MEAVSWAAVVMAAISMIGNAVTTLSNNRTRQKMEAAKLAHDEELGGIRHELTACRNSHAASESDRTELRTRLAAAEKRAAEADRAAQGIRLELASIRGRLTAEESRPKQG